MKVSVEQKPGAEITLTGSVTAAAAGWTTILAIPAEISGKLRHFQMTGDYSGTARSTDIRILRGAITIWQINDRFHGSAAALVPRHYDCNQEVVPGDLLQLNIAGTPSFTLEASCVATIFPPTVSDRFFADESYPICGLKHVDQGRPDIVWRAALSNMLTYLVDPVNLAGGNPVKKT